MKEKIKNNWLMNLFGILTTSGLLVFILFGSLWLGFKAIKAFFGLF